MESISCLNTEAINLLKYHSLFEILIQRIVRDKITKDFTVSETEIKNLKEKFFQQLNLTTEKDFEDWTNKFNTTPEIFMDTNIRGLKIEKYHENKYGHLAESKFLKDKESYDSVIYRLIRVSDRDLANEIYLQLKDREIDFGSAATKYSLGNENKTNGLVGPVALSSGHPAIRDLLKTTKENEINQPIQVVNWWTIVKLESFQEAIFNSEMKTRISHELFEEVVAKETKEILRNLSL